MVAAVGAAIVASVTVTVLVNGALFSVTPASSETGPAGDPDALIQGDVDCDGAVGPIDALKDLRYDAGLSVAQNEGCPDVGTVAAIPGPQGPPGDPGISGYEIVLEESDPSSDSLQSVTADCPVGKSILGGGARVVAPGGSLQYLNIYESRPVGATWRATAMEIGAGTPEDWYVEVRAICATVSN